MYCASGNFFLIHIIIVPDIRHTWKMIYFCHEVIETKDMLVHKPAVLRNTSLCEKIKSNLKECTLHINKKHPFRWMLFVYEKYKFGIRYQNYIRLSTIKSRLLKTLDWSILHWSYCASPGPPYPPQLFH